MPDFNFLMNLIPIFAADPAGNIVPEILASVVVGTSLFALARTVVNTLHSEDLEQDEAWRYDVNRINELRRQDLVYRVFHPLVQLFARFNRIAFREYLPEIGREIQAAGLPRFWTSEEYLGKLEVIALFLAPAYLYAFVEMMGPAGAVMACVLTIVTGWLLRRRLAGRARYRLLQIKRRLPFLLDLLTLLMEAGSTFLQALAEAVDQFGDHAVGYEFGRVLSEINMGKGRTGALEAMRDRLSDDEITSIVGSIIQGEELGTPLARLFRTQADVLRIKRTQRAETIAGEAGVKMLLPAVLVMASTVLIILGPFVLGFLYAPIG
jgi:tight adherence protein C